MQKNQSSPVCTGDIWTKFEDTEKVIALYLAYAPPPVLLDNIISISDLPPVRALNIMENFKKLGFVSENSSSGKGIYFPGTVHLQNSIWEQIERPDKAEIANRVISFINHHHENDEEKSVSLAKLYIQIGNIEDGSLHIKRSADILNRSGEKEKAVQYYDVIIEHFNPDPSPATQSSMEDFLDSAYLRASMAASYPMPDHKQLSLLEKAHDVAKRCKQPLHLARIKIFLGFMLLNCGKGRRSSRLINEFWELYRNASDKRLLEKAFFLASITIAMLGRYSEASNYYKKMVGNLQDFGNDEDDLLANLLIAFCQVSCGKISRGMGMIEAVRNKAQLLNFGHVIHRADFMNAMALLQIKKIPEAEIYIDRLLALPEDENGPYRIYSLHFCKAYILCMKESHPEAFSFLKKALMLRDASGMGPQGLEPFSPWIFECLYHLESKGYSDEIVNIDKEIEIAISLNNLCIKGAAYRYRALRNSDKNRSSDTILNDLKLSEKTLKRSGAEIELARTRVAMRNFYLTEGKQNSAESCIKKTWLFLRKIDKNLLPKDLLDKMPWEQKIDLLVERTTAINRSLRTIRDQPTLLEMVINVAMDITSATQGCFFIHDEGVLKLIASRNIVLSPLHADKFAPVKKIFIDSIKKNKEIFLPEKDHALTGQFKKLGIRSFIGIPVKIDEMACGFLALGNHFGDSPFPENTIPFVRMFASQIEVALTYFKAYEGIQKIKDRFEDETFFYRREMGLELPIEQIVGNSKGIKKIIEQIRQVAPTDSLVLVTGETGVGKELVAKAIHNLSERKDGPFIPVNLATFPKDLVASELFGYEKGAFSGATERKKGRFELADRGTIFLDEIGDLPLDIQVKLLRVLQEGTFERLGSSSPIESDFRVVAATNKDLRQEVKNETFRQDLYYRLNVFPIHVPPLRERKEDIEALAKHFFSIFDEKLEKNIKRLPAGELEKLNFYHWPGNVRELKHFIERAVILSNGYEISFSGLETETEKRFSDTHKPVMLLAEAEREHIENALKRTYWRISGANGAAALLGLPPSTLRNRMKKLGIGRPPKTTGE